MFGVFYPVAEIHYKTGTQAPQQGSLVSFKKVNWRRIARTVKYARIPFLVLTVFGLGHNQGIIDYSRDPNAKRVVLLNSILAGVGATSKNQIESDDERARKVRRVGHRMTNTAKNYVESKLRASMQKCVNRLTQAGLPINPENLAMITAKDGDVELWSLAQRHMEGKWEYLVIESHIPNAFVSEVLPHHIFMTTSMLENFIENDDEMGLILGHELSHLILGHVSSANALETFLRAFEVLLLSIDPTEGLASLAFMFFLGAGRTLIGAAYSKENERAADELGIKLAAMACYDTRRASKVFEKLHKFDTESAAGAAMEKVPLLQWFDSHPSTIDRSEFFAQESENENKEKYMDDECSDVKGRLMNMLKVIKR